MPSSSATSPRWEPREGDAGLGGLPAPGAKPWLLLGRAGRKDGTAGITMSSSSGRRVSIATGLARKSDCGSRGCSLFLCWVCLGRVGRCRGSPCSGHAPHSPRPLLEQHQSPLLLSPRSPSPLCPALVVVRGFGSLVLCWQQPVAVHLLTRAVPAPPGRRFSTVPIHGPQFPCLLPKSKLLRGGSTPVPDAFRASSGASQGALCQPQAVPPPRGGEEGSGAIQPPSRWVAVHRSVCHDGAANAMSLQLEAKAGKGLTERALPDWKVALKREREEHQHLLAESYSAVMDLTKQLQISEKNWNQEKVELLARFKEEQQQAEQQAKDLQNKLNQVWCPQPCACPPASAACSLCLNAPGAQLASKQQRLCVPRGAHARVG